MNKWLVVISVFLVLIFGCTNTSVLPANNTIVPNSTGTVTTQAAVSNLTAAELILQLERSVVEINNSAIYNDSDYGPTPIGSLGSGVIYAEDNDSIYIVTNRHVVDLGYFTDYGLVMQDNISVTTFDNQTVQATGRWIAPDSADMAILVIPRKGIDAQVATISNSTPQLGDSVFVIGMPEEYTWSVSKGIVSAMRTNFTLQDSTQQYDAIQTDAAVNPGNSGGGMFSQDGLLIGIPTWTTSFSQGLNFAISIGDFIALKDSFIDDPPGRTRRSPRARRQPYPASKPILAIPAMARCNTSMSPSASWTRTTI